MAAYDPAQWHDLFVAVAGAGAALAGLVFVAVSINITQILEFHGMPDRAFQALIQLLAVVIVALLLLAPGQSNLALGLELLAIGIPVAVASDWLLDRALNGAKASGASADAKSATEVKAPQAPTIFNFDARHILVLAGSIPFALAGLSLLVEWGGGLYWVLAGTLISILVGVLNAWVLLVEIRR